MARSVPLTEGRATMLMYQLLDMLTDIGDGNEIGDRFVSCLYGHKPAFLSLCGASTDRSQKIITEHARRDIIAEFLPVVGSLMGFNSQLSDSYYLDVRSGWLDNEIGCAGNRSNRFVMRKLPYVAYRSLRRTRLIHLVRRINQEVDFPDATVWDVLAILRSCRQRLPSKCAICVMPECSWFCPKYERYDRDAPRSCMMFFLDGRKLDIRNVSENAFVPKQTLFLSYVTSTVDLLA